MLVAVAELGLLDATMIMEESAESPPSDVPSSLPDPQADENKRRVSATWQTGWLDLDIVLRS